MKNESQPLVTVITVCRNALPLLKKTMANVNAQQFSSLEYIVIDGASTDGTNRYLAEYQGRLTRYVSEPDNGIYDAMNKGVRIATGKWIVFMNAGDCFFAPNTLSQLFASGIDPNVATVYGDVAKIKTDGLYDIAVAGKPKDGHRMFFCHQSSMTRRDVLLKYPFDTKHRLSADFKFFKTLIHAGEGLQHIPVPVAVFDTGGVSNVNRSRGLADNMAVIRETDRFPRRELLIARLLVPYLSCLLRQR